MLSKDSLSVMSVALTTAGSAITSGCSIRELYLN
jgi:hypothetical protein